MRSPELTVMDFLKRFALIHLKIASISVIMLQFEKSSVVTTSDWGTDGFVAASRSNKSTNKMGNQKRNINPGYMQFLKNRLRILKWLPEYNKNCFLSDMIAGVTVGLTMMPQSIAYASIAELPPHVGLYTAIMGSFIYIFFGTIKQVSIGPSSILSLLTYSYVQGRGMDFVILLTFMCGCVELLMGIFNLGFIMDFISAPVTSGFTSAVSLVIVIAQLKNIFGIHFHSESIFEMVQYLILNFKHMKLCDTVLGITSMAVLLTIKKFGQVEYKSEKIKKCMWVLAICRNALVVLIGTVIAFSFEHFTGNQPFAIAGDIMPGLPPLKLPNFTTTVGNTTVEFMEMMSTLGSGIIVLPVVAVLANVAIAKTFADGSVFDATQEMMTLGVSNIMGSFVGGMPTTGAFTRSAVNNASNVQTPMAGLYAGTMILLALSFLTPYFYFIPKSSIAAVLICAVMFMVEYWELPRLWRCNKFDFFIGLTTFTICLVFGVNFGLMVGVGLNLITLLKLWARPKVHAEVCSGEKGSKYLKVHLELGLLFPAVNHLTEAMLSVLSRYEKLPVVMDMKSVISIDYTACRALNDILKIFKKQSQQLVFINVNPMVHKRLRTTIKEMSLDVRDEVGDLYMKKENYLETPLLEKIDCS